MSWVAGGFVTGAGPAAGQQPEVFPGLQRCLGQRHLGGGDFGQPGDRLAAQCPCRLPLSVTVDQQYPLPARSQSGSQADGGGSLADPTL
jgi:hypothetical protein